MSNQNHYMWKPPQRTDTMFLATIQNNRSSTLRNSSFQQQDIPGSQVKQQIQPIIRRQNFNNSAFIQPPPQSHIKVLKNNIPTNNLRTHDIEGAWPNKVEFKTARNVNPLNPRYKLPYVQPVDQQPVKNFLRNTLDITDIVKKRQQPKGNSTYKEPIEGSTPMKHFKTINATSRLQVKDINQDGIFKTSRKQNPTNPLQPNYVWKDQRNNNNANNRYGDIGNRSIRQIPEKVRKTDMSLNIHDIEGTKAGSSNERKFFFQKRKQYHDPLKTTDISKAHAHSLNKGITTRRNVNPLVPNYRYPQ